MRAALAGLALLGVVTAAAAEPRPIKIGVLTDMNGPAAAAGGIGSVEAARMASAEFHDEVNGRPVQIVYADHGGQPDTGAAIAGRWFDLDGVDVIVDMQNSAIGFAVQTLAAPRHKIMLLSASTSSEWTGRMCSPWTVQWTIDTYGVAVSAGNAVTRLGGKSWFFITVDQVYGHSLSSDTQAQVKALGGTVAGEVTFPPSATDFASELLQAQASGADVLAFATSSGATETLIKEAAEFGLTKSMRLVALQSVITDIYSVGLPTAQGLYETSPFYWDRTPQTRAWSEQFFARTHAMPSGFQAGVYSEVRAYLQAIATTKSDDPAVIMAALRAAPVNDVFATDGHVRADGKMVHDLYLLQVKPPAESHEPWDLYKVIATLPGDSVARPLADSQCKLVRP